MKESISEYTEEQFIQFMEEIFRENEADSDEKLDVLLDQFRALTGHPDGSDLIYYAASDEECTPEAITQMVKAWRAANGLPGFKDA
ncbi:bacteriocin immunity protein [Pseudomonas sp. B14-6]|uniref:bacteriocin immunity protein n=1 Tax=Pseudomonas sp. B14-6 TaxID=2738843 RepID=UPI00155F0859|nr:bacteriocin immunity protein [Pseudomonas sp. B14-6]QKG68654.1 bacteriocin immunity protein [Pseudomonas sp. B14-6]